LKDWRTKTKTKSKTLLGIEPLVLDDVSLEHMDKEKKFKKMTHVKYKEVGGGGGGGSQQNHKEKIYI